MEVKEEKKQLDNNYYSWVRIPSTAFAGQYVYKNTATGEVSNDLPPILEKEWEKRTMNPYGDVYYHRPTGQIVTEAPEVPYGLDVKQHEEEVRSQSMATLQKRIEQLDRKNKRGGLTEEEQDEAEEIQNFLLSLKTASDFKFKESDGDADRRTVQEKHEKTPENYAKQEPQDGL